MNPFAVLYAGFVFTIFIAVTYFVNLPIGLCSLGILIAMNLVTLTSMRKLKSSVFVPVSYLRKSSHRILVLAILIVIFGVLAAAATKVVVGWGHAIIVALTYGAVAYACFVVSKQYDNMIKGAQG